MTEEINSKRKKVIGIPVLAGAVIGFILCGAILFVVMPSVMIAAKECKLGFDETVTETENRIPQYGWVLSGGKSMDMNKSFLEHGADFGPKVKLIKLCKHEYAKSILETDREVSCMMPCTMAVWEGDDGKVYLSKMNMSLMAKMFGGNISKIMGGKVAGDEEKILEGLLKK